MSGPDPTEVLFREHKERLMRFARHLVGPGPDAEDLVQETFLRAHHHLANGREIRAPLSFLFVTMRNLVNDAGRQKRNEPIDAQALPEDEVPSAERHAMSERELERLCIAITQLPERMRYAFVLRKVYGYSCHEIAERLGRSVNTVREQVAQGFKRLRAMEAGAATVEPRVRRAAEPPTPAAKGEHGARKVEVVRVLNRGSSG